MGELNNTINQVDLAYIYRIFYSVPTECASFSSAYGLFPREDHMLGNKTRLNKFERIELIQCKFSRHNEIKLEIVGVFGIDMYTRLYLKSITNKILLYSTGNSAQCYVAALTGGEFEEWTHVYAWLSPSAVLLKLSQHCFISYEIGRAHV